MNKKLNAKSLSNLRCYGNDYKILIIENLEELFKLKNFFILGRGTNTMFLNNQKGIILSLQLFNKINILSSDYVEVEAGVQIPFLINYLKKFELGGLEFCYPVPASLGGMIAMNFSAFGENISQFISEVNYYDQEKTKIITLKEKDLANKFFYRNSFFLQKNHLIISCKLKLIPKTIDEINTDTQSYLAKRTQNYPLKHTLGCIFKNPNQLSAGKLLDECGFKGYKKNQIQISSKHANVLIANERTKPIEIKNMIEEMQLAVYQKFLIKLEPEIVIY